MFEVYKHGQHILSREHKGVMVTVGKGGLVSFSRDLCNKLGLKAGGSAEVSFDKDTSCFKAQFFDDRTPNGIAPSFAANHLTCTINCKGFFRYFKLTLPLVAARCEPSVNETSREVLFQYTALPVSIK